VIHQDLAHHPGGNGDKMRPILPLLPTLVNELEIRCQREIEMSPFLTK